MELMRYYGSICILLQMNIRQLSSEKILVIHPVYAGSHILAIRRIIEELLHRGHQIRVIRFSETNDIPVLNSTHISETILSVNNSEGSIPFMTNEEKARFQFPAEYMWKKGLHATSVFAGGMTAVAASCKTLYENEALMEELQQQKFKMAIVDLIFNECGLALAHHLRLPVVGYWGLFFMSGETQYTTAFNPPSALPHIYTSFTSKMSFLQRVMNTIYGLGSHILMQVHFHKTNYYIQKHLRDCPHPSHLLSELSGVLINSHWAFDYPKQLPPSFFHVGGIHIREPRPLSQSLSDFADSAEDGLILMSMGFNFDAESIPSDFYESMFRVFGKLKQKVILRSNSAPNFTPKNVKILPNVPQADILAHPNTVLFITHCGMHGVMEAIHFGVKMVGIPIFFDQINVAVRLQEKGVAVILEKHSSESEIQDSILKVLSDRRYEDNMKLLTRIYQNSFENPMGRAVWLIEHVMEFNGANHLKLPSKDFNFLHFFVIDVALFIAIITFMVVYMSLKLFLYLNSRRPATGKLKLQ